MMIHSAGGYSLKLENEIKSNITVLRQIIEKRDSISDELLINMVPSEKNEMDELLDEMEFLTDSIRNYD